MADESREVVARKQAQEFLAKAAMDTVSAAASLIAEPMRAVHGGVRLIRAYQSGNFVEQLAQEWDELQAAGRIAKDYGSTDQCRAAFSDILESLDENNFDAEQLDLLRRLFLAAASEKLTNRESPLPREYIAIGRSLSAGELEVLAQTFRYIPTFVKVPDNQRPSAAGEWLTLMMQNTRLQFNALIEIHEQRLMEKGLLFGRLHSDRSGIRTAAHSYRLTDLGLGFCQFLESFEDDMVKK